MQAAFLMSNPVKLQKMASSPTKLACFACDIDQTTGLIHLGGGYAGLNTYNRAYLWYDIKNNLWHTGASLTYNYYQCTGSVVKFNNQFYMEGGYGGASMATSDYFPISTTTAPTVYTTGDYSAGPGRYAKAFATIGNKLYMACGVKGSTFLNYFELYDFNASAFTVLANAPISCNGHELVVYSGNLYLVGGYDGVNAKNSNAVHRYDVSSNTWTANFATLPNATSWTNAAVYKDYLISGVTINGYLWFQIYNFLTSQWLVKNTGLAQRACSKLMPDPNISKGLFLIGGVVNGTVDQMPGNDAYNETWFIPEKWFMF